jgi:hypothetical protein
MEDIFEMIFLIFLCLGSSTVKGMALDSCLVFNEGDSKLYTNIEFCEEKNHRQFAQGVHCTKLVRVHVSAHEGY